MASAQLAADIKVYWEKFQPIFLRIVKRGYDHKPTR